MATEQIDDRGAAPGLAVFRFIPVAGPEDPVWQDRPIFAEVVVAAPNAAEARLIAARGFDAADPPFIALDRPRSGPGFEDPKLYRVVEQNPAEAGAAAPATPGVIRAELARGQPTGWGA